MKDNDIVVYFDADGVLADFRGRCDEFGIKYNPMGVYDEKVDIKMWDEIRKDDHFYLHLKPVEGSVDLFKNLSKDYRCEVLTAIPKEKWNIPNAGQDKIDWCKKYLGEDVKVNLCYRREKQNYVKGRNTILVDDLFKNIQEWERQGGCGILFTTAKDFDRTLIDIISKRKGIDAMYNNCVIEKGDIDYACD